MFTLPNSNPANRLLTATSKKRKKLGKRYLEEIMKLRNGSAFPTAK
jgi:hypothetical protein